MKVKENTIDWNELVQRESPRLEWKENVASIQNVVKTLCAFANDFQDVGGGRVVCGLKEEKNQYGTPVAKAVGLEEKRLKEIKNKVLNDCHRFVEPPITPVVTEYPVENNPSRRLLIFAVTSSQYAHRFRTKKDGVNYYIRLNDRTRPADGLIPQLLERKKMWPPYLAQTHPEASLEAIDLLALKEFLGQLKLPHTVEKYLEPDVQFRGDVLDLVTYPPGRTDLAVPRNFTLLLFGREPHRFFSGAYAIFSVYQGLNRASERSQRYEAFGPVPLLIRNLMSRLQFYMGMEIDKRPGMFNSNQNRYRFSDRSVQEAIVNAFVHRDYHSHDPVRVTLFNDRIEIISPGGTYAPIDPGKIQKGEVFTSWRNPSLAWFMVQLGFAQNEGQGIRMIIELTKHISGKEPLFNIDDHWFQVVIPAYVPQPVVSKEEPVIETAAAEMQTGLPVLLSLFEELKERAADVVPELREELYIVQDSLDELTLESDKKELVKPLNKLGRLLRKLNSKDSDERYPFVSDMKKGIETLGKLNKVYNKFAQWLALPPLP